MMSNLAVQVLSKKVSLAVGSDRGAPLMAFVRFIRFAKIATFVANVWTISYVVLIGGWQTYFFLSQGDWPALTVKSVFETLKSSREIYEVAATRGIRAQHFTSALETLLLLPAMVPLLLAATLLTLFYFWLSNLEKQYRNS
jgi:hypothetical protein